MEELLKLTWAQISEADRKTHFMNSEAVFTAMQANAEKTVTSSGDDDHKSSSAEWKAGKASAILVPGDETFAPVDWKWLDAPKPRKSGELYGKMETAEGKRFWTNPKGWEGISDHMSDDGVNIVIKGKIGCNKGILYCSL